MISRKIFSGVLVLALILGFTAAPTFAGDPDRIGTAAGVQVQIPVGARDIAMGGANIALTSGVDAIFWNPAGLPRMGNVAVAQFSTMQIFSDIGVNYLAVAYNDEDFGAIGFSIKSLSFGDIPWTTTEDMDGETGRTFNPTFVTMGLTYSRSLTENVYLGLTAKLITESVPRAEASAFAFDVGLQYDQLGGIEDVSFGVTIKNIGTNLRYEGSGLGDNYINDLGQEYYLKTEAASNQLPTAFEFGVAYSASIAEDQTLSVPVLFQSNNFENDAIRVGLEYSFQNMLFARGGYNYALGSESEDVLHTFALGAGIHYPVGEIDLMFDYSFRNSQYFDANNIFTLAIGF
jgi:hypothetical protein